MSKASILKEATVVYTEKRAILVGLEEKAAETVRAKATLEKAKLNAMTGFAWDSLKNETQRDQYLKVNLSSFYDAVEQAQEAERKAKFSLTLVDLRVEHLKLVIKVNCEWQQEVKLK